nr:ROK family protein [Oscillospiraceae bacterium]
MEEIVDYDTLVLKYSVHSPEWGADIPVGAYLKDIFGDAPYYFIENAGKCISRSILNELEQPDKRILVLFTSWGLSGALIQDGKILSGRDSLIGEIGHMILDPSDTEQCSCGSFGCLERLVSIARLRKRIALNPPPASSPLSKLAPEAVNLNHLFFASRQEDAYARAYVTYLADCFSVLLRNVSLVFNPETVVFVGDYSIADDYFDQRMRQQFHQFHYLASSSPMEVRYDTRLLPELDARGGAVALLDHFFSDPKLYAD